jgi:hypothetical protein
MPKLISLGFALVVSSLFVVGCSTQMTPVKGPDGQSWIALSCRDSAKNCWQTAGDYCPAGYDTADEVQSTTHGFLFFGHHSRDEMLIRCRAPETAKADLAKPEPSKLDTSKPESTKPDTTKPDAMSSNDASSAE